MLYNMLSLSSTQQNRCCWPQPSWHTLKHLQLRAVRKSNRLTEGRKCFAEHTTRKLSIVH